MTFRILTVCTGNVCRSPLAERLLRAGLDQRFGPDAWVVEVASAGVGALAGEEMTGPTQTLAARYGADGAGHVARALVEEHVAQADLVLAMTRQHRGAVLRLHPAATRKTFTLRELARLVPLVDPAQLPPGPLEERLRALVPAAAAKRGLVPVADPSQDDVLDPYRGTGEMYEAMAGQVVPAVEVVLGALGDACPGSRSGVL